MNHVPLLPDDEVDPAELVLLFVCVGVGFGSGTKAACFFPALLSLLRPGVMLSGSFANEMRRAEGCDPGGRILLSEVDPLFKIPFTGVDDVA
jgi:hypothetical protein